MQANETKKPKQTYSKKILIGLAVTVFVAVAAAAFLIPVLKNPIHNDTYQLVKLDTGEIYVGKLVSNKGDFFVLQQAYLQNQPATKSQDDSKRSLDNSEVVLTRMTSTVAKPEDTLYLSKNKVIYWSNLQPDSKVVKVIQSDK